MATFQDQWDFQLMATGSSDSPPAEAASAQEAVCASESASPKATKSHCSRFSAREQRDEQQGQQTSQLRRRRRGPVHAVRAVGSRVQHSISKRQQQLQDLEKDLLCLRIFNEVLPHQLVNEVRQQLQEGAGHAAAVEHVARTRLHHLAAAEVRRLFLALAGALSASCAAVHVAKRIVRRVARPLRLRRPVGLLVNPVLMPTSLYGPLLGAYVITIAARGALRQMALEAGRTLLQRWLQ
ncbi:hypothetical protein OEZ86_010732 [Tetradesmus obliquus]|nr:hypothetical protein OEZ86_010732 [Tetradesmus obliquus]